MMKVLVLLIVALSFAYAQQRCETYIQEVRKAHYSQFGVDFPYQYGVGQLQQESECRNIISRDGIGSEGLSQITYRVWQKSLKANGVESINAIPDQLKAQAIIMHSVYKPQYGLWVTYQIYNGGGLVLKEINRAKVVEWSKAKEQCRRGKSCFTYKGLTTCRSNCEINYEYSQNIFKYGGHYGSIQQSNKYRYW
jgi:hypothetical protein